MYCSILYLFSAIYYIGTITIISGCVLVEAVVHCVVIQAEAHRYKQGNSSQNCERFLVQCAIIDKINCTNRKGGLG